MPTQITIASVSAEIRQQLATDLSTYFPDAKPPGEVWQLSQEPPAWIEIIADLVTWSTVFKVAAVAYVTKLAQLLAEEHWKHRSQIRALALESAGNSLEKIQSFFGCFRKAESAIGRRFGVALGIPRPGVHLTRIHLDLSNDSEVLEQACFFFCSNDAIPRIFKYLDEREIKIDSDVACLFEIDRVTLKWYDNEKGVASMTFDLNGEPVERDRGVE